MTQTRDAAGARLRAFLGQDHDGPPPEWIETVLDLVAEVWPEERHARWVQTAAVAASAALPAYQSAFPGTALVETLKAVLVWGACPCGEHRWPLNRHLLEACGAVWETERASAAGKAASAVAGVVELALDDDASEAQITDIVLLAVETVGVESVLQHLRWAFEETAESL